MGDGNWIGSGSQETGVAIVGAGIAGLTLALQLDSVGIASTVFEAAPAVEPLGVGINILPHASRVLCLLGLESPLLEKSIATANSVFYNRFGQLIYSEPLGRAGGYEFPQFSIHRGDLQEVLLKAAIERRIPVELGHKVTSVDQDQKIATLHFDQQSAEVPDRTASVVVGCDGIHSVLRKQLHPAEGDPRYSGVNMWRGVTIWPKILDGASMIRAGWLTTGKMVIYPIRDSVDEQGRQLINWVAELETERYRRRDWSRPGSLDDFAGSFANWQFDWMDVPAFLNASEEVLEYPMVDQDPLSTWTDRRITLLGDAAHPMVPRGSNGAGQAILDAKCLSDCLVQEESLEAALARYEYERLAATSKVVLTNRVNPPDIILKIVADRTGDRPFDRIEDVISEEELKSISDSYKSIAGYSKEQLAG